MRLRVLSVLTTLRHASVSKGSLQYLAALGLLSLAYQDECQFRGRNSRAIGVSIRAYCTWLLPKGGVTPYGCCRGLVQQAFRCRLSCGEFGLSDLQPDVTLSLLKPGLSRRLRHGRHGSVAPRQRGSPISRPLGGHGDLFVMLVRCISANGCGMGRREAP
ncbi:hypothetical protein GGR52DRAFT_426396 [Hypoxylon sp. FL1284]|nr:hypothetical protein GGR52DRAFT_426396 [Hypoxylon sp. FL1284]